MESVRRNRLALAVSHGLLWAMLPIASQAQSSEEVKQLDSVVVTGSRIRGAELAEQVPVLTVTREDIARSGLTSVADIVQQLTAAGSSLNTKFNSSGNFGFPPDGSGVGAGSATVDLRHLGSKRVLVLVDGIRWVSEASASGVSSSTDLNTIPVSIIEQIEVLEDGASSIYGSDAIAGVVNIITRRDFDGVAVSAYTGGFEAGGDTNSVDLSFGAAGDNYSFFMGVSYSDQDAISSTEWEHAGVPKPGTGLAFGSSATPNGRFIFFAPSASSVCPAIDFDDDPATPDVPFCNITTPNGSFFPGGPSFPGDFIGWSTASRFNYAQYNLMLTPSERKGVFAQGRFSFSDSITGYARVLYNQRESMNQAAPEPLFLGPDAGTGNAYADNILISADNPYNPFGFDLISSGPGANLILIGRRPIEGGPRQFYQDVDTFYFGTGLEGQFDAAGRSFYWDINYAASRNEANQTNYGSYNIRRINMALGRLANCQADPQCVPLDIFSGPGSITPEMLAYIQPVVRDYSENNLHLVSGNLSGDLFELPAGSVSFATGFEHRRIDGRYQPDTLTVAGEYNGVPSLPTAGAYDVSEYYLEFNVPVYQSGASRLDLSLAGRYSDYSTFGGTSTGKFGFRWQFNDQFLMRGSWAEGFRAPSIGELYGSAARFDAELDDPCLIGVDGSPAEANCSAFGVPAGAAQANSQISVTTGGNPDLLPEESDSMSVGFVWSPAFAADAAWSERLDVELTWYRHEVDGAVQAIDAQTQLDLCVAGGPSSVFCNGITRASTGGINGFNNRLQNFGAVETDGFDFDVFWTLPESDLGEFKLRWQNTFVEDYRAVDGFGVLQPRAVGVAVNDTALPEWTSTLGLDWSRGSWEAGWSIRHISDLTEACGDADFSDFCSNPALGTNRLGSTSYHDLRMGWKAPWFEESKLSLGVNNVFGKEPPICLSCSLNGYEASTYDVPAGRFWYIRVEAKF